MDEFQYRVAIERLADFDTVLTDEELETYCEYTMGIEEQVLDSFSIFDRLLQQRIITCTMDSKNMTDFVQYCICGWESNQYG